MPLFHLTKAILWAALAAAATFAFISRFTPLSVTLVVLVIASVAFWLARHSTQLRTRYLEKEAANALPTPHDKLVWGDKLKPRLKDLAPGLAFMGLVCFYFAYKVSIGATPTKFAELGYQLFGLPGAVGTWCLGAVILLATGVESMLGSRAK